MSEEEQEVYELLKEIADVRCCTTGDDLSEEDAKIITDLIENQQKEIEELKTRLQDTLSRQKDTIYFYIDDYVSKDKIRETIKELENFEEKHIEYCISKSKTFIKRDFLIELLQQLLEEK